MTTTSDTARAIAITIVESGANLPPLPSTGRQLLELAQKPLEDIDAAAFTKLIEPDPGLTIKVLQLANSAYFGTLNKIVGLRQAIMHIGLQETINTVCWFFYRDALPKFPSMAGFSGNDYWAHSWACATANRMLGHPSSLVQALPGELYLAGLLHGVGKLILAINRPEEFLQCLEYSLDFGQPLEQAERDVIGTTDSEIAYAVLKDWNFPDRICEAIRHYHNPEAAEDAYREMAALTQFAYYIANTSGVGNGGDDFCRDISKTYIATNWTSPLADLSHQKKVLDTIYADLNRKSQWVAPGDDQPTPNTASPPVRNSVRNSRAAKTPPSEKNGFWDWLLAFFG